MNVRFVQTDNEGLFTKRMERSKGKEIRIMEIGIIRHRSDLKKVIEVMALELQHDESLYNEVSQPYRHAQELMYSVDEATAENHYDKVLAYSAETANIVPAMVEAQRGIADALFSLGRYDEAISAYRTMIQIYPELSDIHYQLGRCYFEIGEYVPAIQEFEAEVKISGEASDILLQIGSVYFSLALEGTGSMTNLEKAKWSFESGLRIDPDSNQLRECLYNVLACIKQQR